MQPVKWLSFVIVFSLSCGEQKISFAPPLSVEIAVPLEEKHPLASGLAEWSRLVSSRTDGTCSIRVHFFRSFGSDRLVIEKMRRGSLDLACVSSAALGEVSEEFSALSLPFVFKDDAHCSRVLEGDVGRELLLSINRSGLIGLAFFDPGGMYVFSKKRVSRLEDFKDLKIRVSPGSSRVFRDFVFHLEGLVVPFSDDKVGIAMGIGLIDAAADTLTSYNAADFRRGAKYITYLPFARQPLMLVMSGRLRERLSGPQLEFLRTTAREGMRLGREKIISWEREFFLYEREKVVIELMPAEAAQYESAANSVLREQNESVRSLAEKIKNER